MAGRKQGAGGTDGSGVEMAVTRDLREVLEWVSVGELKPHPRNDGWHPPEEIAHLRASIRQHGIDKPVVIAVDGTLLTGHGLVQAAREEGWTEVPATRKPYGPEHPLALARLVGDNQIAKLRRTDEEVTAELLRELAQEDMGALLGTGWSPEGLEALLGVGQGLDLEGSGAAKKKRGRARAGDKPGQVPEHWSVVVTCVSEGEQAELLGRLMGEGYTCRALIS